MIREIKLNIDDPTAVFKFYERELFEVIDLVYVAKFELLVMYTSKRIVVYYYEHYGIIVQLRQLTVEADWSIRYL